MIKQTDFPALTDDLQSIFNEAMKSSIADSVGMSKVFNVEETDRLTYDHQVIHGVAGVKRVAEGEDFPRINSEEGDNVTWTQKQYAGMFSVTKKMRKFDLHNQIRQLPKTLVQDAMDKVDQSLADVLTNGWSTSYTDVYNDTETSTGPDGLSLFGTAHTNGATSATYRNQIKNSAATENPGLSYDAIIQARVDARVHSDPNGLIRPVRLDTLVVAPSNEELANRLLYSTNLPGSMDNDINPLRGKIQNLIVWERLETRSDGTDTSGYWFMFDSSKKDETLKALFAERPSLDAPDEVYTNKNWDYSLDYFYTIGRGYEAFVWGSQGTS